MSSQSEGVPATQRTAFRRRRRQLRRVIERAEARLAERILLPAANGGAAPAPRRDGVLEELLRRGARVARRLRRAETPGSPQTLSVVVEDLRAAVRDVHDAAAGTLPAATKSKRSTISTQVLPRHGTVFFLWHPPSLPSCLT